MTHSASKDESCTLFLSSLTFNSVFPPDLHIIFQTVQPYHRWSTCHVAGTRKAKKGKKRKLSLHSHIKRALLLLSSFVFETRGSVDFEKRGQAMLIRHPESHQMMRRGKYVGKSGCFTSEASDLELLRSDHPSREETRIFTALIQVCGAPDGYSGPRQSGRKRRGLRPKNFQVRLMSAFMERGVEGKPAQEFKRIVCKLS